MLGSASELASLGLMLLQSPVGESWSGYLKNSVMRLLCGGPLKTTFDKQPRWLTHMKVALVGAVITRCSYGNDELFLLAEITPQDISQDLIEQNYDLTFYDKASWKLIETLPVFKINLPNFND